MIKRWETTAQELSTPDKHHLKISHSRKSSSALPSDLKNTKNDRTPKLVRDFMDTNEGQICHWLYFDHEKRKYNQLLRLNFGGVEEYP